MIVIQPHSKCVNLICFAPGGTRFASVSQDGWLKVWDPIDLQTAKPVWEVDAEASETGEGDESWLDRGLTEAQYMPDGKLLLTGGWHQHLRAWDAATGELKWNVHKPRGYGGIGTLVVSRDGSRVAFAGGQLFVPEQIFVINPRNQKFTKCLKGHDDACGALAAGPEGLVSGGADKHVKFWSWNTGRCYHDLTLRGTVRGLQFSPDGSRLAASGGAVVMLWDMLSPSRKNSKSRPGPLRECRGHTAQVQRIDFSPDSRLMASAAHDGTVRTWDVASGTEIRAFNPKVGKLHHVAFAPDGLTVVFTSEKGHIGVFDLGD